MSNKNKYNNYYNGKQAKELEKEEKPTHDHSVVLPEESIEEEKEKQVKEIIDVESTDPNTVETTTISGTDIEAESTEENEVELTQNTEETNNIPTVRVNTTALNIRKEPSKESDIVTIVYEDDLLMLQESTSVNGFYKIKTYTGFEGYCMEQFVNLN